jgi:hypothetical protein
MWLCVNKTLSFVLWSISATQVAPKYFHICVPDGIQSLGILGIFERIILK